ncbi:histidinol-phosphate aminotransferase [Clostridia bacterium]|nr:histidinol-phosphate aminotransferase [Clostridia bacterium]
MSAWEENVRRVVPYVPGEQPKNKGIIKLNTNENPYPPSPLVESSLHDLENKSLRLYPDPTSEDLVKAIGDSHGLRPEQVFVGVGSDDVLAMAFLTFFSNGNSSNNGHESKGNNSGTNIAGGHESKNQFPLLFPDITYSFYSVWADLFRIPYATPPLDTDFRIQPRDYCNSSHKGNIRGIVLANPNAPTGLALELSAIRSMVQDNPDVVVIIDEAYIDFGGETAIPLLAKYDNLLVTRTFSKSRSLAGMRIGYALGQPKLIAYLNDVKYSFNSYTMSKAALICGVASLQDKTYFEDSLQKIKNLREWTKKELKKLGFVFGDSAANFIFANHPKLPAKDLFLALKEDKIYVRYFDKPRIDNYLRITIGTEEEMRSLISALRKHLKYNTYNSLKLDF